MGVKCYSLYFNLLFTSVHLWKKTIIAMSLPIINPQFGYTVNTYCLFMCLHNIHRLIVRGLQMTGMSKIKVNILESLANALFLELQVHAH